MNLKETEGQNSVSVSERWKSETRACRGVNFQSPDVNILSQIMACGNCGG